MYDLVERQIYSLVYLHLISDTSVNDKHKGQANERLVDAFACIMKIFCTREVWRAQKVD